MQTNATYTIYVHQFMDFGMEIIKTNKKWKEKKIGNQCVFAVMHFVCVVFSRFLFDVHFLVALLVEHRNRDDGLSIM